MLAEENIGLQRTSLTISSKCHEPGMRFRKCPPPGKDFLQEGRMSFNDKWKLVFSGLNAEVMTEELSWRQRIRLSYWRDSDEGVTSFNLRNIN